MDFNHKQISLVCPIQFWIGPNLTLHYWFTLSLAPTKIRFKLAGWYENPITSVVLTFPLDKIVFPAVTLCPRDSRPDRWGSVIKIFDQLNTDCGSKRWGYTLNSKANEWLYFKLFLKIWEKKWTFQPHGSKIHSWKVHDWKIWGWKIQG